jgi:uncharacterized protein DUF3237
MARQSTSVRAALVVLAAVAAASSSAAQPQTGSSAATALGTQPAADVVPRVEFAFEERVTLAPAVVLGETPLGHRQYIPITGGTIAGPRLKGEVIPGGWDFQLRLPGGCGTLSADYFLRADDGTVIHILNESFSCAGPGGNGERSFFRPRFEAPKGPHEWLNRASFVALLELEPPPAGGAANALRAIRIKFFQIK